MINYPWTRNFQRYEYIVESGYVTDREVIDVGAGSAIGSLYLTTRAKRVFAVDPFLSIERDCRLITYTMAHPERVFYIHENIYDFIKKVDVCIVVEVMEHMVSAHCFIKHLTTLCDFAFITSPLNKETGKTDNPYHNVEFSTKDFDEVINSEFEILDKVYQKSDLSIVDSASYSGSSMDSRHVVQMAWCRRKDGR